MRAHRVFNQTMIAGRIVCLMLISAGAAAGTSYTNDTDWGGADLTLYDGDVIAGSHSNIGHFAVAPGATATVEPYGPVLSDPIMDNGNIVDYATTNYYGQAWIETETASIDGTFSADGAGFPHDQGDGAGTQRSGGSYGGRGAAGSYGRPGDPYGSENAPDRLGSGGGHRDSSSSGSSGGGAIVLEIAGLLTVSGTVSVNGEEGDRAGGGSGGSVWLKAGTLDGAGLITADGGAGDSSSYGGGGGGRIAFDTPDNQFTGTVRARGGLHGSDGRGRHGTFNFQSDPNQDLTVQADIALPPGANWTFRSLTVPTNVTFEIQSTPGTDAENYEDEVASRLEILEFLTVEPGGKLSADGLGYPQREGPEAGTGRGGGGYGGRGGTGSQYEPGDIYGDATMPDRLGSGGGRGHSNGCGGSGGGALILDVGGILTVNGELSANGIQAKYRGGGGSGGSVWLQAGTLAGAGWITADGGRHDSGGGGGGGRIAFDVADNQFAGTIRARGGLGGSYGSGSHGHHGTFNFQSDPMLDLVIEADIALPPGTNWVFRSLTVPTNVTFEIQSIPGTSAADYADEEASRLDILDSVLIAAGGTLSANGMGYRIGRGEGRGTQRSGSGYGGAGGQSTHSGTPGAPYGDAATPDRLGSGGGRGHSSISGGAAGSGALILTVGETLSIHGTVSANGLGSPYRCGGGSGGSVWLTAAEINGAGHITADGGEGQSDSGGGGGGGRIRLDYGWIGGFERRPEQIVEMLNPAELPETLTFSGSITVAGGPGHSDSDDGEDGTILFRHVPFPLKGTMILLQ